MFLVPISRYECDRTPVFTIGLAVLSSLFWLVLWLTSYPQSIFTNFGFIAARPSLVSLVSALFLHQGIIYLLPNMLFLFVFGKQLEDVFGHLLLLGSFIVCGLAGTGLFYLLDRTATAPCTGSTGAVAGIVGFFWIMFPNSLFDVEVHLGWWHATTFKANTLAASAAWLGWQLVVGLVQDQLPGSFVLWANIGGFVMGLMMAQLLKPTLQRQLRERSRASEAHDSVTTLGL